MPISSFRNSLAVLSTLAVFWGCAGVNAPFDNNEQVPTSGTDASQTTDLGATTEPKHEPVLALAWVSGPQQNFEYNATVQITVKFTRDGKPYAGEQLTFRSEGDIGVLEVSNAGTDGNGIAKVTFTAGANEAQGVIWVQDKRKRVAEIKLVVAIGPKADGKLRVILSYAGKRNVTDGMVMLLKVNGQAIDRSCADLDYTQLPTALRQESTTHLAKTLNFKEIPNGTRLQVVAIATNSNGYLVVRGCHPQLITIEDGRDQELTLSMADIAPSYVGAYRTVYTLDLTSSLPEDVRSTVNTVFNTIKNPGNQVMKWICDSGKAESVCKFKVILDPVITALVEAAVKRNTALSNVFFGARDVIDILKTLKVESDIRFTEEPNDQGIFESGATEKLRKIRYRWTYNQGCDISKPECGVAELPITDAGMSSTPVALSVRVRDMYGLSIQTHAFDFSIGKLLASILEKGVLPAMMNDQNVDSFDNLLYTVLGGAKCLNSGVDTCCNNFDLAVQSELSDTWAGLGALACKALVPYASEALRNQLKRLDSKTTGGLLLGTGKFPCTMIDSSETQQIDRLGSPAAPCMVDAKVKVEDTYYEIDGSFFGIRTK